MKKIGSYTARGVVTEQQTEAGEPQKIPLFDGSFSTGYRVTEFYIWTANVGSATQARVMGKLSKNDDGVTSSTNFWRADDDNQIGWAVSSANADGGPGELTESLIDPDNMIIEDLFVYARTASTNTNAINYMVVMEKYEITDWQGALAMARDRAQGDI
jgi:hypothetical protein